MARVLLFGKDGQLGKELQSALRAHEVQPLGRAECDLRKPGMVEAAILEYRPDYVINAAAFTAVDKAESERDTAFAINATAVGAMAQAARDIGAAILHFSTDYVFDGSSTEPYVEGDATGPLNAYGESKLAGEELLCRSGAQHIVLRTSWVYSSHGRNFLDTMLRLGATRSELRVVDDQVGAPTSAADLAAATATILERWQPSACGIYHCTAQGEASWAEFARAIFAAADMPVNVLGIPGSEYPTPAKRPANSRLCCDKFARAFGVRLPDWHDSVRRTVQQLCGNTVRANA